MMISNLPRVLIEEIFARVPLRSLREVRLTCKTWNTLSKSESFIKMYTSQSATSTREKEESMINYNIYLMRIVDSSIEFKYKLSFFSEQVSRISQVFHCEGLLLCIFEDNDTKVVVLNPYCGQMRWIEARYSHRPRRWDRFGYALGYENNESSRSLKLLRFIDYWYNLPEKQFFWYEIYDFDSCLWTTLDVTPYWSIRFGKHGVSLKGNTYWCAQKRNGQDDDVFDHIICFDFTREKFGPLLPLPSSVTDFEYTYVTLSCVREEKLAVLCQVGLSSMYEPEIWITTKIDVEMVSWSKFLRVNTRPTICTGFLIDEEKKIAMGFSEDYPKKFSIIGEAGYLRHFNLGVTLDPNCWPDVCCYVPSLVQIKKPARGKRKRESSLENRRFDQNMLRLKDFEKSVV